MFLNCTAHKLTEEQKTKAWEYSDEIVDIEELNPALKNRLINCPALLIELNLLADDLLDFLQRIYVETQKECYVHLPIGSPAFMSIFFMKLNRDLLPMKILFSHSVRVSYDEIREDGSVMKKAVFKFIKFLEI